jgi:hypothetical protein
MNLTLSLAINDGGGGGTTKKRKLLRDSADDDVMSRDGGGDRSSRVVARLVQVQARERKLAKLEAAAADDDDHDHDPRVAAAETSPGDIGGGLRLMHLLLSSVAAAESGDAREAAAALREACRRASFRSGDPAQRVAAYFADALASRLVGRPPPTRAEQFLAYTMFYQASPIYQLAHFTANQAILEAFESGGGRLHVVDFDVSYGFQWPSLMQSLSDAASTSSSSRDGDCAEPVSLRITGFGTSADELRQTEARLARFASGCPNLRFEFEGIVDGADDSERITVDDGATVVVNLVFPAAAARSSSATSSTGEGACSALARIRSLDPSLVFLVEKGGGGGGNATSRGRRPSLLAPFAASLRYFAAVFDSLHERLPADSAERLAIERDHLGAEISDAVASLADYSSSSYGGDDEPSSSATAGCSWRQMMERAGFEGVELSSRAVSQAKLLLKMKGGCGGGFRVVEEGDGGRAVSLGWRDGRAQLITATGWWRCRSVNDKQAMS